MERRTFLQLAGGAAIAWPLPALAQQSTKVARIGYLSNNLASGAHNHEAFRQALRDLGYVDGRGVLIERDAEGRFDRLPALAAELVELKVDVIVAPSTISAQAAKQVTGSIPIVFATAGDPVTSGLVASLAQPGYNITGLSSLGAQLVAKRLELLKQAVPLSSSVAVLWQPGAFVESTERDMLQEADIARRALGMRLHLVKAQGPADFDEAFSAMIEARADAMTMLPSPMFFGERRRILDLVAKNRVPTVYPWREFVDTGGLMSYGANFADLYRRAATYAHKILEGAKPSDLPVEQPTKYEFIVNLKAASALGLTVPPTLLATADEVID